MGRVWRWLVHEWGGVYLVVVVGSFGIGMMAEALEYSFLAMVAVWLSGLMLGLVYTLQREREIGCDLESFLAVMDDASRQVEIWRDVVRVVEQENEILQGVLEYQRQQDKSL